MTSERESLAKECKWDWGRRSYSLMSDSEKDELAQRFGFDSFYDYVNLDTTRLLEPSNSSFLQEVYANRHRSTPNLSVDDKKRLNSLEIIENLEKDLRLFQDAQLRKFGKRIKRN